MEQTAHPTPVRIFMAMNAYQQTAALKSAIDLDLFTAIGEGHQSVARLAARCQAAERGVRILCDYLTVAGFLAKAGQEYSLDPETALFLDKRSPAYLGCASDFLNSPLLMENFNHLTDAVRKGGTAASRLGTIAPEHPVWIQFARAMAPMVAPAARGIAAKLGAGNGKRWKVLDIAAGHGLFGIAIAAANPNAEVHAVDWPLVLEVAKENAAKAGIGKRYFTLAGSAFTVDFGAGYDIVLLTNFLHHFDPETCVKLLRRLRAAMMPDGRVATLEFVPNPDRVTPPMPAAFSLIMLGSTPKGDAYTFAELDSMFRDAGFGASEMHPLQNYEGHLILTQR